MNGTKKRYDHEISIDTDVNADKSSVVRRIPGASRAVTGGSASPWAAFFQLSGSGTARLMKTVKNAGTTPTTNTHLGSSDLISPVVIDARMQPVMYPLCKTADPHTLCRPPAIGSSLLAAKPSIASWMASTPGTFRARSAMNAPDR